MPETIQLRFNKPQSKAHAAWGPDRKIVLPWGRGVGKALALDTPIPTPDGWTTMGEIAVGDRVFDENGVVCAVTDATDVMHGHECFAVAFDDGSEIVADASHEWFTWDRRARKSHGRAGPGRRPTVHPAVRTTDEIRKSLASSQGETNHSVPVAKPLELPACPLPIDPYALGAWLGDGTSCSSDITMGAEDFDVMHANLAAVCPRIGKPRKTSSGAWSCTLGVKSQLRSLGLLNNKHIPKEYLRASEWQRERLLAGLLDTDGHCDPRAGAVEFTNTNERLAHDVAELIASLGLKFSVYTGRATLYGRDCGPKWRIYLRPRKPVFGFPRKNANIPTDRAHATRTSHRYIVAVRPISSVPVRCIAVSSPSRLFLAGKTMIPTHNSWFERTHDLWCAVAKYDGHDRLYTDEHGVTRKAPLKGVRLVLLMPTFAGFRKVHADLLEAECYGRWAFLGGKLNRSEWSVKFPGGSIIQCMGMKQADGNRGIRCDGAILDECDDIPTESYDAITRPWFSEPWSLRLETFGGTPRMGRYGLLWREHSRGLAGIQARLQGPPTDPAALPEWQSAASTYTFHATYKDAPETVAPAYVAKVRAEMERDGAMPAFHREWECSFDSAEGLVFPMFDEGFHVRDPDPDGGPWSEFIYGVDHGWEHPGVMLAIGVRGHGRDAECYVLEEVWEQRKDERFWVDAARAMKERWERRAPSNKWYGDPSQPARIDAIRKYADVNIVGAANHVEDGIAAVAARLAVQETDDGEHRFARLYVSPRCPRLIKQFSQYRRRRDPNNQDLFLDEIEKVNDDGMDALRYAIFSRFGGPGRAAHTQGPGW